MKRLGLLLLLVPSLAFGANSVVLTWTAPTLRTDGSTITGTVTYSIFQGPSGAEVLSTSGVSGLTFTVNNLAGGATVCWTITATEAGNPSASAATNEVCKTFPLAPPDAPTNLTVK